MKRSELMPLIAEHPAFFEAYLDGKISESSVDVDAEILLSKFEKKIESDKLSQLETKKDVFSFCLAAEPSIDFYLKLFKLQELFQSKVEAPTYSLTDELSVKTYTQFYLEWLKLEVAKIDLDEFKKTVHIKITEYAAHFSGKLIHSDIPATASVFCQGGYCVAPYISSRTLIANDEKIPLDQSQLDNEGIFQRLLKILNDDPLVKEVDLDPTIRKLVLDSAREVFRTYKLNPNLVLDRRLRQILIPSGNNYISLSPLASGGFSLLVDNAITQIKTDSTDSPSSKKKGFFTRLNFPVGGAVVRNVSIHPGKIIQNPLFFEAPVVKVDLRLAYSFIYKPLKLSISQNELKAYSEAIYKQPVSIRESSATTAVKVETYGILRDLVLTQHEKLLVLSDTLQEVPFREGEDLRVIDETLLIEKRENPLKPLDLAVVNGVFDKVYAEALATELSIYLYQHLRLGPDHTSLHQLDRDRIKSAILKIMDQIL